jgi:allantoate deiminase
VTVEINATLQPVKSFAVQAELALSRCAQEGQILRTFLSPPMEQCHQRLRSWMEAAGMNVGVDRVANLRGYYAAREESASTPRLIIASHLDTVPNAGKYDGILGVVLGLGLVEALEGRRLNFGIEVIGFSDEEGVRYGVPRPGPSGATGRERDPHGIGARRLLRCASGSDRGCAPSTDTRVSGVPH